MGCEFGVKDAVYYLKKILPKEAQGIYTVASSATIDPSTKDFTSLQEALEWAKISGNNIHGPDSIEFILDDGIHHLKKSNILKAGISTISDGENLLFMRNVNIKLSGSSRDNVTIEIDSTINEKLVFLDSTFYIEKIRLKIFGLTGSNVINIITEGGQAIVDDCKLDDVSVIASSNGIAYVYNNIFTNNNNIQKTILLSNYTSIIYAKSNNFSNDSLEIEARNNSKISFVGNTNTGNLTLIPTLNYRDLSLSVIYDETQPV